ncbi:MAG: hypothetical protein NUW37_11890 [Planctomycetes bacterium]|nr:hypothetical protein [Planctomycetota bacterium]
MRITILAILAAALATTLVPLSFAQEEDPPEEIETPREDSVAEENPDEESTPTEEEEIVPEESVTMEETPAVEESAANDISDEDISAELSSNEDAAAQSEPVGEEAALSGDAATGDVSAEDDPPLEGGEQEDQGSQALVEAEAPEEPQQSAAERIEELIGLLGNDEWSVRESAYIELSKIGEPTIPRLQEAVESDEIDYETRWRIESLFSRLSWHFPPGFPENVALDFQRFFSLDWTQKDAKLRTYETLEKDVAVIILEKVVRYEELLNIRERAFGALKAKDENFARTLLVRLNEEGDDVFCLQKTIYEFQYNAEKAEYYFGIVGRALSEKLDAAILDTALVNACILGQFEPFLPALMQVRTKVERSVDKNFIAGYFHALVRTLVELGRLDDAANELGVLCEFKVADKKILADTRTRILEWTQIAKRLDEARKFETCFKLFDSFKLEPDKKYNPTVGVEYFRYKAVLGDQSAMEFLFLLFLDQIASYGEYGQNVVYDIGRFFDGLEFFRKTIEEEEYGNFLAKTISELDEKRSLMQGSPDNASHRRAYKRKLLYAIALLSVLKDDERLGRYLTEISGNQNEKDVTMALLTIYYRIRDEKSLDELYDYGAATVTYSDGDKTGLLALDLLKEIDCQQSKDIYLERLRSDNWGVFTHAAGTLVNLRATDATKILLERMETERDILRKRDIAHHLVAMEDTSADEALIRFFEFAMRESASDAERLKSDFAMVLKRSGDSRFENIFGDAFTGLVYRAGNYQQRTTALNDIPINISNELAWLCAKTGLKLDDALILSRKCCVIIRDSDGYYSTTGLHSAYLDTLAELHFVRGEFELAVENARNALTFHPTYRPYYERQLRKFEEAKRSHEQLQDARNRDPETSGGSTESPPE